MHFQHHKVAKVKITVRGSWRAGNWLDRNPDLLRLQFPDLVDLYEERRITGHGHQLLADLESVKI